MSFGMGRCIVPDFRDTRHPMTLALDMNQTAPDEKEWKIGDILDQGNTFKCTSYAWRAYMLADPNPDLNPPSVDVVYDESQKIDGIPGRHDGSTVRAAAQVLTTMNHIDPRYVWAYNSTMLQQFLLTRGPVVFGVTWYQSFFYPDANGIVSLSGPPAGGHAFLCCGFSRKTGLYHFVNSWGVGWGKEGQFWARENDVSSLLKDYGEACSAVDLGVLAQ